MRVGAVVRCRQVVANTQWVVMVVLIERYKKGVCLLVLARWHQYAVAEVVEKKLGMGMAVIVLGARDIDTLQ